MFPLTALGAQRFSDAVSQAPIAAIGDFLVIVVGGLSARFVTFSD